MSRPDDQLTSFLADGGAPDRARVLVESFATSNSLGHDSQLRLELVLEELVMNTLAHGAAPEDSQIRVQLHMSGGLVRILYEDHGIPFDPRGTPSRRDADPWHVGGFGWDLVRGMCDQVGYERRGDTNVITATLTLA